MNEFEKGYIAGLLDGEGSVFFKIDKRRRIRTQIAIYNNNKEALKRVQELLGYGAIYRHKHEKNKDGWSWYIGGRNDVQQFIKTFKDCTIIKRKKLLELEKFCEENPRGGNASNREEVRWSKEEIDKMLRLREEGKTGKEIILILNEARVRSNRLGKHAIHNKLSWLRRG